MTTEAVADRVRAFFKDYPNTVVCVYLFGSTARGEARPGSDVDVGVLFKIDPPSTLTDSGVRLAGELERHLGRQSIW